MKIELISHTADAGKLCGEAAAVCTNSKNPESSLRHAVESGHESVLEHGGVTFCVSGLSRAALVIPADFKEKICETVKYCTLPELEMLLIISEGLVKEYEKVKFSVRPKVFAKEHIRCNQKKYDNSSQFYRDYYGSDCGKLIQSIRDYKRIRGSHRRDELYLADILK